VYLPEELFPEIQRAESDTSEGWAIFNHLMQIKKNAYPEKPVYPEAIRS